jgi:signal transduction histidine kinase
MFRPFNKLSPHMGGLGLGLSIVQRSVIANNRTLSVRNSPGIGCLFTISLPRHEWQPPPSATPSP